MAKRGRIAVSVFFLAAGIAAASAHASNRLTTGATDVSLKALASSNTAVVVYQALRQGLAP